MFRKYELLYKFRQYTISLSWLIQSGAQCQWKYQTSDKIIVAMGIDFSLGHLCFQALSIFLCAKFAACASVYWT